MLPAHPARVSWAAASLCLLAIACDSAPAAESSAVLAAGSPESRAALLPFVDCVEEIKGGLRVRFGYVNKGTAITVESRASRLIPAATGVPPTRFMPGRFSGVFTADVSGSSLRWELQGAVAAADRRSVRCPRQPPPGMAADCPAVTLIAWRTFVPLASFDADARLESPLAIELPGSIPVVRGGAGDGFVELAVQPANERSFRCFYAGGVPPTALHAGRPTHAGSADAGPPGLPPGTSSEYSFVRCTNDARPGRALSVTALRLRVLGGDDRHFAGRTEVHLPLGRVPRCGTVIEVPTSVTAADDPAVRGLPFDPAALPPALRNPKQEEEARTFDTDWQPEVRRRLAPGESHAVSLRIRAGEMVLARVHWQGPRSAVELSLNRAGRLVARGNFTPVDQDEGAAVLRAAPTPGQATVVVTNRASAVADISLIVGTLDEEELP